MLRGATDRGYNTPVSAPPLELFLPDPEATRALGRALGAQLVPGLLVALLGDLGAGKTALSKAAIAAQGAVEEDDVTSPTFVLAGEYPGRVEVLHLDVYRLAGPDELEALGLELGREDARAVLVEWAERVAAALPADRLTITLEHRDGGRGVRIEAGGPRSAAALEGLRAALG